MLRIGLIGAEGRLGKAISDLSPTFPILRTTPRKHLPCDVLLDVSSPDALSENLSANLPIVIGTTGHTDFSLLENAAKTLPIFYTANFSLGVALLHRLVRLTEAAFPSQIHLEETHHIHKKDAPSGTALSLAKLLPTASIESKRKGEVIGEHTISFLTRYEELILSHKAHSRDVFAVGALAAARFLATQPPGLYGMDNLLNFEVSSIR